MVYNSYVICDINDGDIVTGYLLNGMGVITKYPSNLLLQPKGISKGNFKSGEKIKYDDSNDTEDLNISCITSDKKLYNLK